MQSARRVAFPGRERYQRSTNMPVSRQQIIIRVFRKYSHSLGPEELEYLDEILKEHDIPDGDVDGSRGSLALC